jgi:dTMP kinase
LSAAALRRFAFRSSLELTLTLALTLPPALPTDNCPLTTANGTFLLLFFTVRQFIGQRMPGLFVTFEGGEACGKSTQLRRLVQRLEKRGRTVLAVHEPGFTEIGSAIRQLLLHAKAGDSMRNETELLLFAASRAQLVRETIRPAIEKGWDVLSDRFYDSTTVYQGIGRGLDMIFIKALNEFATGGCRPDRTFLLDLEVAVSRARQLRRVRPVGQRDRMERLSDEFFEQVRRGYLEIARTEPDRIKIIDASGTEEEVEEAIWDEIDGLLA